jgi:hypothetical protein
VGKQAVVLHAQGQTDSGPVDAMHYAHHETDAEEMHACARAHAHTHAHIETRKDTCDCAAACRRTAPALEGAAMQPNAWRRIARESTVNACASSQVDRASKGGCCKATAARSTGRA